VLAPVLALLRWDWVLLALAPERLVLAPVLALPRRDWALPAPASERLVLAPVLRRPFDWAQRRPLDNRL